MKNNFKSLSDIIPYWHFDNDLMVFSDGSLGKGFKLEGIDISCLTPTEINQFSREIENLISGTSEGLRLQVFYRLMPNVSELLTQHVEVSKNQLEVYEEVKTARLNFLNENEKEGNFYMPEIFFFIRSTANNFKKRKFWEKEKKYMSITLEKYQAHKDKFLRSCKNMESSLRSAKLKAEGITSKEWFNLAFDYLNLERSKNVGIPKLIENNDPFTPSLVSQLCLTDLFIHKDKIQLGNTFFKVITLKTLPEGNTFASMIDLFTKQPFHFFICQNINILNQTKETERLELQRRITHSMAAGSEKISDLESESKLAQLEDLINELLNGSEKLVTSDFNVIIWSKDEKELEENADEILKSFQQLNQSEGLAETLPCFDAFIGSLPGGCVGLRHKKMKSSNACDFMPLYSFWKGNKRPVCLLPTRDQGLFSLDIMASELPAWNALIFGGTGSGKSFSIIQLMLMFYGQNPMPKIIWIDNGASSQTMLDIFNGEFIDLHLESGICLNMFDLQDGEDKPTASKIKLILGVLEVILKDEDKIGLPKREKALLEEAIFNVYEKVQERNPTLSDLRELLKDHSASEMNKFAEILFSWTGNTAYGKMLDGQSNVKLTKDLVTIEIKGLDNHRELKDIFLLLFTSFIKEEAARDLATPYILIIDEAARLFKTPSGKDFAIDCYRVFRKYNAAIWCISQNYKDFMSDSELSDALMPNTTHVFILRQKKIDWNDFKRAFDFNDAQLEAAKSLEIVKGEFSEFLYIQDENMIILRIIPDNLAYQIGTSDGNDKVKIKDKQKLYPELPKIEILKKLAYEQ